MLGKLRNISSNGCKRALKSTQQVRMLCSGNTMSDKEIHESYTMMKKLELLSTLLTKPGTKKIEAMRGKKIGLGCTITRNLGLFVETNHPLLDKYELDLGEFMQGAEHAFHIVTENLYSEGFRKFALRESNNSVEASYLETLCTPQAFAYFLEFAASGYGSVPDIKVTGERFATFGLALYKLNIAVVDDETPGATDEDDLSPPDDVSRRFFGSPPPPSLGVEGVGVGTSAPVGRRRAGGSTVEEGNVPHYGDSLSPEQRPVDHSPTPNKSQCCTVALMDVNYVTDVMRGEEIAWSKITQWRYLGYLSAGSQLEWRISSVTPIWPPF